MPLPREHLLDELATAYVQAVAANAGATLSVSRRDYGVDGTLNHILEVEDQFLPSGFPIEFQLKGTTTAKIGDTHLQFDLKVRSYDPLVTREAWAVPLYLFLVCFDQNPNRWIVEDDEQLALRAAAYWWLKSDVATLNRSSVRIEIPITNRLTSRAIEDMLQASRGRFNR
jgi:hypothetical protein